MELLSLELSLELLLSFELSLLLSLEEPVLVAAPVEAPPSTSRLSAISLSTRSLSAHTQPVSKSKDNQVVLKQSLSAGAQPVSKSKNKLPDLVRHKGSQHTHRHKAHAASMSAALNKSSKDLGMHAPELSVFRLLAWYVVAPVDCVLSPAQHTGET